LADVPSIEDEACEGLPFSSEKAPSAVLGRLLEKLPRGQDAHRSFAQKCFPKKGPLRGEALACAREVLSRELGVVQPEVVLCFGFRALTGVAEALRLGDAQTVSLLKAAHQCGSCEFQAPWGAVAVVGLPSALELERFPEWRSGVWERLAFLR
jgi:uracil-DNA glycosylase